MIRSDSKTLSADLSKAFKAGVRAAVHGDDFYAEDFPVILGQGSLHDLSDGDPRNPRLAGLKSVSYAAACSLRKSEPQRHPLGFHRPNRPR